MAEGKEEGVRRKINTFLFMLAGTVFNLAVMLAFFLALIFLANFFLTPESSQIIKMAVFFMVIVFSVLGTFFLYSRILRWINGKWDLDRYLHPLFGKKR